MTPGGLPDPLDVEVAGVGVRIRGAGQLQTSTRQWVESGLLPFAAPGTAPEVTIDVTGATPGPGRRIEHGFALVDEGLWVGDRFGLGAVLDLHGDRLAARVHPAAPRSVLSWHVYLVLVRAALARRGADILRMAAVEVDGRRVGIGGWSGSGKTRLVLTQILHHGGRLLGDQVLANLPDGTVAPLTADLRVRAEHADLLLVERRGRSRLRRGAARRLDELGARSSGGPVARLSVGLAEILREGGETRVGAADLAPGRPLGAPGALDTVVLLRDRPAAAPIDFLLGTQGVYLALHDAADHAARAVWPEVGPLRLGGDVRREVLEKTLAGVAVVERPAPLLPPDAKALAAELAR